MAAADRDASGLLPARRHAADERRARLHAKRRPRRRPWRPRRRAGAAGPADADGADRARLRPASAGRSPSDRSRARASREDAAAHHVRMVGVVGRDAAAEARGAMGCRRIADGRRSDFRRGDGEGRCERAGRVHDRNPLHGRAHRRNDDPQRQGARLHRLSVARTCGRLARGTRRQSHAGRALQSRSHPLDGRATVRRDRDRFLDLRA